MDGRLDGNNDMGGMTVDSITVKTNRIPRELVSWFDLPPAIREDWFDYVDEDDRYSYRFVKYRGSWYDVNDSEWTGSLGMPDAVKAWDGIVTESFFSGVLFKYADSNCESVIVGRYYS